MPQRLYSFTYIMKLYKNEFGEAIFMMLHGQYFESLMSYSEEMNSEFLQLQIRNVKTVNV